MWGNKQDVYFCFWVTSITTVISSSIYWLLRYGVSISGSQLSYCCKSLIQLLTLWSPPPIRKLFILFSITIILLLSSISVPKTKYVFLEGRDPKVENCNLRKYISMWYRWMLEHSEFNLVLTWTFHPFWLPLIVLKGSMYPTRRESNHQSHPTVNTLSYNNDPLVKLWHQHHSINQLLWDLSPVPEEKRNTGQHFQVQNLWWDLWKALRTYYSA